MGEAPTDESPGSADSKDKNMLRILNRWFGAKPTLVSRTHGESPPMKRLPVIDTDSCSGCGECVKACDHHCLGMIWSFATLLHPGECGSEGRCMDACPHGVIRMDWVEATGDEQVGIWCEREACDDMQTRS